MALRNFYVVLMTAQRCPTRQAMFCPHTMVRASISFYITEIEEDSDEYCDEDDGVEDSDDALPADEGEDEEWENCEEGEDHEETNYHDEL
ncbi:hypothetical protein EDB19DRAFT_1916479 [Suillus lakei]|nr:hypothetical protein EDB19DRAFT_1916479 [Suillus lakei]